MVVWWWCGGGRVIDYHSVLPVTPFYTLGQFGGLLFYRQDGSIDSTETGSA